MRGAGARISSLRAALVAVVAALIEVMQASSRDVAIGPSWRISREANNLLKEKSQPPQRNPSANVIPYTVRESAVTMAAHAAPERVKHRSLSVILNVNRRQASMNHSANRIN